MARILIVDDDHTCRTVLRSALQSHGHEVTEAQDGFEAIERFDAEKPALVLLDACMPNKDGIETLGDLRHCTHVAPVIAISGGGLLRTDFLLHMMLKLGATECLAKPYSRDALASVVNRHLRIA